MNKSGQQIKNKDACCRDEEKMVRCAMAALEKMNQILKNALGTDPESLKKRRIRELNRHMDAKCRANECPSVRKRKVIPNVNSITYIVFTIPV